jgi:hypothetical protein
VSHWLHSVLGHLLLGPERINFSWLSLAMWPAALVIEFLILFRGFRGKMLSIYPVFYAFIACVLAGDLLGYVQYVLGMSEASYAKSYWIGQFVTMFIGGAIALEALRCILPWDRKADKLTTFAWLAFGAVMFYFATINALAAMLIACAVIVVIFRHALLAEDDAEGFPGISRIVLFGAIICSAAACVRATTGAWRADQETYLVIERDFYAVQAILWLGVIGMLFYYGLAAGRNLKGIILGCALGAGSNLMIASIRCYVGHIPFAGWNNLQPLVFLACTLIWLVSLWNRGPVPALVLSEAAPVRESLRQDDARSLRGAVRTHPAKAARP